MQVIDQLKRKIRGPNLFLMSHTVSIKFPHLENLLIFFLFVYLCTPSARRNFWRPKAGRRAELEIQITESCHMDFW